MTKMGVAVMYKPGYFLKQTPKEGASRLSYQLPHKWDRRERKGAVGFESYSLIQHDKQHDQIKWYFLREGLFLIPPLEIGVRTGWRGREVASSLE